jgi:hypothetical protein
MLRRVVLTRATRHSIPEHAILHINRRENLKSYVHTDDRRARRSYCRTVPVEGVVWLAQQVPTSVNVKSFRPKPLFFLGSSSSFIITRLSGIHSRLNSSRKMWKRRISNPGPLDPKPRTLTTRPWRWPNIKQVHQVIRLSRDGSTSKIYTFTDR